MQIEYISGTMLDPVDKRHALAAFVHRYTGQHTPAWIRQAENDGLIYPVQFADDSDWLANTRFAVTRNKRLDSRVSHCISSPTWPNNPELRKP